MIKKYFALVLLIASCIDAQEAPSRFTRIRRANRRLNSKGLRVTAADSRVNQALGAQPTNGDEELYADKRASFGKALPHDDTTGLFDVDAFNTMVRALETGDSDAFLAIPMGATPSGCPLTDPQASLIFSLIGADSWIYSFPAPPTLTSAETAGEMVEDYWMALLRDVPFNEYGSDPLAAQAVTDMNTLSDFKGPKVNGLVTSGTLFRGQTPGDLVGPFISQFLYLPIPYGPKANYNGGYSGTPGIDFQAQIVPASGYAVNDFMTDMTSWLSVEKGISPSAIITFEPYRLFIRNGRDLADYVHNDSPPMPYVNAGFILLSLGKDALDPANPFLNNATQKGFVEYGNPDMCYLVSVAAEMALRAAWYFKWQVHRRVRPEVVGFYAHQQKTNTTDYGLHSDLMNSNALTQVFNWNGTYFLPMAYPEGSPTHPSYPAGHAVVAGACVTILKAFFNEDFVIPNPVMPNVDNDELVAYTGDDLTVGGELNKLAANIALGRDIAGVHYRSDGVQGILLGEQVALAILEDEAFCRNISFNGYSLTKFDGTKITVGAKRTAPQY